VKQYSRRQDGERRTVTDVWMGRIYSHTAGASLASMGGDNCPDSPFIPVSLADFEELWAMAEPVSDEKEPDHA